MSPKRKRRLERCMGSDSDDHGATGTEELGSGRGDGIERFSGAIIRLLPWLSRAGRYGSSFTINFGDRRIAHLFGKDAASHETNGNNGVIAGVMYVY